jgi:GT2 family glycosyltransferase
LKAALETQTVPYELIVVDNGSRSEDQPRSEDLPSGARILRQASNLGFAEGNNVAARAATTEFIALLNPDAFPEPDWLAHLLIAADRSPRNALIGSTQLWDADHALLDGVGDVMHASGLAYRSAHRRPLATLALAEGEVFSACAAAMLIRRAVFLGLGGFEARYFCYMEDVDFGFRLRLAGGRALQAPRACVRHVSGGVTSGHRGFADFYGARNRVWTFVRCMPGPLFWTLLPAHVAATIGVLAIHAAQGRWASWRGAAAGLRGLGRVWGERRVIQAARRASVADIAGALAWSPWVFWGRRPVVRPLKGQEGSGL